jgi:hypothetical protein
MPENTQVITSAPLPSRSLPINCSVIVPQLGATGRAIYPSKYDSMREKNKFVEMLKDVTFVAEGELRLSFSEG